MADVQVTSEYETTFLPPGTFLLIRGKLPLSRFEQHLISADDEVPPRGQRAVILDPVPSSDPNEPLNWSPVRKATNFTLVLAVTCLVFTALSIQPIFWQLMVKDLGLTFDQLNRALSVNFAGLATGCIFFIPLARKFGRRPVYLASTALMLATTLWMAEINSLTELYISNLLQGLAGSTNESIVQITVADLFFVHHRGGMNALYMTMVMTGSFLTPMAAGTQALGQGWRWPYRTMGICNVVIFMLLLFFYEETKYAPVIDGIATNGQQPSGSIFNPADNGKRSPSFDTEEYLLQPDSMHHGVDETIPLFTWSKRLSFITPTSEPIGPYFIRPFIALITFPAVLFSGLQYAAGIVWLTIMATVLSLVLPLPPYNFNPQEIGFMSVGPLIGNIIGAIYGGILGDRSILFYSRRNQGYYEPEMRLYILHFPAIFMAGGLVIFGITLSRGMHWIYPSIGGAFFGFGLGSISDVSLTFVIDSYFQITGDAFTGIAFLRNAISSGIPFIIAPWMRNFGVANMFIICGVASLWISSLFLPMIKYGKRMRLRLAGRYYQMVQEQGS